MIKTLRNKLYFDERTKTVPKTTLRNKVIEDIVSEGDLFLKNRQLLDQVFQLKKINLLKSRDNNINKMPGVGKLDYVIAHDHCMSTLNGYKRNDSGGFYTK